MSSHFPYQDDGGNHSTLQDTSAKSHQRNVSSEFGEFHSASPTPPPQSQSQSQSQSRLVGSSGIHNDAEEFAFGDTRGSFQQQAAAALDDSDLLMSFDDVDTVTVPMASSSTSSRRHAPGNVDYLTEENILPSALGSHLQRSDSPKPIHVMLPPKPSEMPADWSPAPASRRVFGTPFPGPHSPPRVSDAGADIVFHPTHVGGHEAATEFRRIRRMSDDFMHHRPRPPSFDGTPHSPSRTRPSIVDALATSRIATKWKRSVLGSTSSFSHDHSGHQTANEAPSMTAQPIDITHKSPFASADLISGSYAAPPDGAPGFRSSTLPVGHVVTPESEWSGTKLWGRREMTSPVLHSQEADKLRAILPPRQRVSDSWSLLFSLDQHGASLSTLYREVEKYAANHRTAGNLLVVRDGENHIFGVYLNEPIIKREGNYYGTGEAFMFKFVPGESDPRAFRWTGRNQYVALCETAFISFGGGGASYGLILDATFSRNSSATSPAFQNEVLCAGNLISEKGIQFDCLGLEVWATS